MSGKKDSRWVALASPVVTCDSRAKSALAKPVLPLTSCDPNRDKPGGNLRIPKLFLRHALACQQSLPDSKGHNRWARHVR